MKIMYQKKLNLFSMYFSTKAQMSKMSKKSKMII